ncbi:GNAT family N-acetyltransferase [Candidatus Latescibacterota bacterium]
MAGGKRAARSGKDRLSVRQFRPADADAASTVMVEAFKSFLPARNRQKVLEGFAPDRLRGASTFGKKGAPTATYVAVDNGKVVGYVSGAVNTFGFGTLSVIGVDPRHFHRGVGSALMGKMVAFWRQRGMRKVSTCVSAHNSRALVFYLKHGFTPVGYQRDHFLEGVDEVILDRFLS